MGKALSHLVTLSPFHLVIFPGRVGRITILDLSTFPGKRWPELVMGVLTWPHHRDTSEDAHDKGDQHQDNHRFQRHNAPPPPIPFTTPTIANLAWLVNHLCVVVYTLECLTPPAALRYCRVTQRHIGDTLDVKEDKPSPACFLGARMTR
jgi:hypothetical protein